MKHARSLTVWVCALGILLGAVWCASGIVFAEESSGAAGSGWTAMDWGTTTTTQATPADLSSLMEFLRAFKIDLTEAEVYDLIEYIGAGGKLDDWLRANRQMGIGSASIEFVANVLSDFADRIIASRVTTTRRTDYSPPPKATVTTTKAQQSRTAVSTQRFYPSETTARPDASTLPEEQSGAPGFRPGDVDGDGQVLAKDARLALRASARLETLSEEAFRAADVNGDGSLLAADARQILRFSARLITSF